MSGTTDQPIILPGVVGALPPGAPSGEAPLTLPGVAGAPAPPEQQRTYLPPQSPATQWGGLTGRAVLQANPFDVGTGLYNTGSDILNRYTGTEIPYHKGPGERAADYFGLPTPQTTGQQIYSGAVSAPASLLMSGPLSGLKYAAILKSLPAVTGIGAGQGAMTAAGLPPEVQIPASLFATALTGKLTPGLTTAASEDDIAKAQFLRSQDVPVNPADLSPGLAQKVYKFGGSLPGSGAGNFADRQFTAWSDAIAKRFGGTTQDGQFTPGVIGRGYARVDDLYDNLRAGQDMPADTNSPLFTKLSQISADANQFDGHIAPGVDNFIHNLLVKAQGHGGSLPAGDVIDMLQAKGDLAKRSGMPNDAAQYYGAIRNALDDEFGASRSPQDMATWQDAKDSYRTLNTVERARDPKTGYVTPASLATAAKGSKYEPMDGDMAQLGEAGSRFITPPAAASPVASQLEKGGAFKAVKEAGVTGLGWGEIMGAMKELGVPSGVAAGLGAAAIPTAYGAQWLGRRGALGAPMPSQAAYYARALSTPGLYVSPQAFRDQNNQ